MLCAAVAFSDDEHLYTYDLPGGRYSHAVLALNDGSATTNIALSELELRDGDELWQLYDMGDAWEFICRVQTIPDQDCMRRRWLVSARALLLVGWCHVP